MSNIDLKIDFNELVADRCNKTKSVLSQKAKEYATDKSRFHNFEVAGRMRSITPEKALEGMWLKHIVSVFDLIDSTDGSFDGITKEFVDEKIGDSINYLILLEGMLKQRIDK